MESAPLLNTGGIIFMGFYLFSLIGVGLAGRYARKENSMSDFYLAGRGMGVFVLFLTLYATQYSVYEIFFSYPQLNFSHMDLYNLPLYQSNHQSFVRYMK